MGLQSVLYYIPVFLHVCITQAGRQERRRLTRREFAGQDGMTDCAAICGPLVNTAATDVGICAPPLYIAAAFDPEAQRQFRGLRVPAVLLRYTRLALGRGCLGCLLLGPTYDELRMTLASLSDAALTLFIVCTVMRVPCTVSVLQEKK